MIYLYARTIAARRCYIRACSRHNHGVTAMPMTYRTVLLSLMLLLPLQLTAQEAPVPSAEPAATASTPETAVTATQAPPETGAATAISAEAPTPAATAQRTADDSAAPSAVSTIERATEIIDATTQSATDTAQSALTSAVELVEPSAGEAAAVDPSAAASAIPPSADQTVPDPIVSAAPDANSVAAGADASVGAVADPTDPGDPLPGDMSVDDETAAFGRIDGNRLNAFLDGLVEASMLQYNLPGAVVTVVEADQIVSSRGWGFANREERELASPANSLFRVGSISKVVTATALMQLVERSQIDLDQPVTRYLDPAPFPEAEAVTVNHLLSHRAGFEDGYLGHFVADDEASDYTLEDYVNRFPPERVRGPGELSSYSNYSLAVIGEIIAKVSGSSFDDYLDQQVLAPLGMRKSSFREAADGMPDRADALPPALAEARAQGYRYSGGMQKPNSRWWMHRGMAPAGSLSATAEDMARFMRLHLNGGELDGVQLLRRETIEQMHSELSRNHPAVGGNAHGFWANEIGGLKTLEHGGAIFNFYSNLVLIPEANIGIFVSTNGNGGRQFTQDLPRLIVEHFLASRAPVTATPAGFADRASALVGVYRSTRRNYSKLEASATLFDSDTVVSVVEPNTLLVTGGSGPRSYSERQPGVFISDRDGRALAFSASADGPAQRLYPNYGAVVLERVPWYARTELFWAVFGSLLVLSVLRILSLRLRKAKTAGPASHTAAVVGWLAALGWLTFSAGMMVVFNATSQPESSLVVHFPDQTTVWVLGIGLAAAALSLLCLILVPFVIRGDWPWWRRWHFALFTLTAVLSLPLLWYWRLLGYHLYGTTSVLLPPLMGG